MTDRYLRREEVQEIVGIGRSTLYRLMRRGEFPLPIKIGRRAIRWPLSEIDEYLASRPRATGVNAA